MSHTETAAHNNLEKNIRQKKPREVGDEQAGFRKNSGTREGIFNLKMIVEKYIETQKDIYACFIDYSKAFDTVNHEKLIECLKTTDIDQSDIALIANLYWEQDTKIRIGNDMSESLKIKRGVRCSLPFTVQSLHGTYFPTN